MLIESLLVQKEPPSVASVGAQGRRSRGLAWITTKVIAFSCQITLFVYSFQPFSFIGLLLVL